MISEQEGDMNKFRGAFVAIVTPFIDGKLDEQKLSDFVAAVEKV